MVIGLILGFPAWGKQHRIIQVCRAAHQSLVPFTVYITFNRQIYLVRNESAFAPLATRGLNLAVRIAFAARRMYVFDLAQGRRLNREARNRRRT